MMGQAAAPMATHPEATIAMGATLGTSCDGLIGTLAYTGGLKVLFDSPSAPKA